MMTPRGVLILTAACLLVLTAAAVLWGVVPADGAVRDALLAVASPTVVTLMKVVNYGGTKWVLVPATLMMLAIVPRARRRWWLWLLLMLVAPLAEGLIKITIARPRPEGTGLGFPSGHATAAAAFFGALIYLAGSVTSPAARTAIRIAALAGALLVALARVVLGAHWPSDSLAGMALGLALAATAALIDDAWSRRARASQLA